MIRLLFLALAALVAHAEQPAVTVFLVRHAEVDYSTGDRNPPLTPAGRERAAGIARKLDGKGVTAVYHTEYLRTAETAKIVAEALGVQAHEVGAADSTALVERVRATPKGQAALVVGHSNTVPEIVGLLGAETPPIAEDEYDRLVVVTLTGAGATATREKQ